MATEYKTENQQPTAKPTPSYKVQTGSEEWSNEVFGCLDGGIEANDHLCQFLLSCTLYGFLTNARPEGNFLPLVRLG